MRLPNAFADLFSALARGISAPFAVLAKSLVKPPRPERPPPVVVEEGSFAPPTVVVDASPEPSLLETDLPVVEAAEILSPSPAVAEVAPAVIVVEEVLAAVEAAPAPCPEPVADPELDAIRARVAALETRLLDLETSKAEIDQLICEYAYCQYQALGDLLGEQLRLQHEVLRQRAERSSKAADREASAAAAAEYQAYRQAHAEPALPQPALADDEREELKALYRAVAMRCHPDRVDEAAKADAHEMFLRTQDAYQRRDLATMRLISAQLAAGEAPAQQAGSSSRERLEALHESLLDKGSELLLAIQTIKMQAQYRQARNRDQWEDNFAAAREQLEVECAALRRQLSVC